MSEISKNIVSLIISKEFHKAKTLIHEAMNNKLGLLLEEKLLEYAPTLYEGGDTEYSSALGGERYNNQGEYSKSLPERLKKDIEDMTKELYPSAKQRAQSQEYYAQASKTTQASKAEENTEPEIDNTELFKRFSAASSGTNYQDYSDAKDEIYQKFPNTDFRKLAKIQQKTNPGAGPPTDWHEYSDTEDHDRDAQVKWDTLKSKGEVHGDITSEFIAKRDEVAANQADGEVGIYPTRGYKTPDAVNDTLDKIKNVTSWSSYGTFVPQLADWTFNNKVSKFIGIPGSSRARIPGSSLLGKASDFAFKHLIFPAAVADEVVGAAQDTYNDDWKNSPWTSAANLGVDLAKRAASTSLYHPKVLASIFASGAGLAGGAGTALAVATGVPVGLGLAYAHDKITGAKEGEGNVAQFQDWDTYKPKNIVAGAQEWWNQYYQRISGNDPYAAVSKDKGIPLSGPIMPPYIPDRPEGPKGQWVAAGTVKNGNGQVMYK